MNLAQPGILAPLPLAGRFVVLALAEGADALAGLRSLVELPVDERLVVGIGQPLVHAAKGAIKNLYAFEGLVGQGCEFPSNQAAVWAFFRGDDHGEILHRARAFVRRLGPTFRIEEDVLSYRYDVGRDLSGYEDGTESPVGEEGVRAAITMGEGEGLDGGSFVAGQRWIHDLKAIESLEQPHRDHIIGRRIEDNEEIDDAPSYAHVKRAAQEDYEPEAFMVRRSMPYGDLREHGLYFVAYGATLSAFERVLHRMSGLEDGVVDGLLRFSRAVTGGYYWCPPARGNRLDLRALGL